jgi:hypothetical protein
MNERIQELAWAAEDYAESIVDQGGGFHQAYTRKFAELVVRECIDKIETYRIPVGNSRSGELACEWTYNALKEIRDDIKETFGVK